MDATHKRTLERSILALDASYGLCRTQPTSEDIRRMCDTIRRWVKIVDQYRMPAGSLFHLHNALANRRFAEADRLIGDSKREVWAVLDAAVDVGDVNHTANHCVSEIAESNFVVATAVPTDPTVSHSSLSSTVFIVSNDFATEPNRQSRSDAGEILNESVADQTDKVTKVESVPTRSTTRPHKNVAKCSVPKTKRREVASVFMHAIRDKGEKWPTYRRMAKRLRDSQGFGSIGTLQDIVKGDEILEAWVTDRSVSTEHYADIKGSVDASSLTNDEIESTLSEYVSKLPQGSGKREAEKRLAEATAQERADWAEIFR